MKQLFLILFIIALSLACDVQKGSDWGSLMDITDQPETKEQTQSTSNSNPLFKSRSKVHHGIDISHFQGDIVQKLDAGDSLRFAICKATQGEYFVDPDFRMNWNLIKEKGMIRGTYHFYDCSVDPVKQANHFTSQASDISKMDIAPILDIEQGSMTSSVSGEQMVEDILVFLQTVEKTLDRQPILYTDYAFAQEYLKDPALSKYNLWLAEYSGKEKPFIPNLWKEKGFKIWQKSDTYSAHSTQLDFDVYFGDLYNLVK